MSQPPAQFHQTGLAAQLEEALVALRKQKITRKDLVAEALLWLREFQWSPSAPLTLNVSHLTQVLNFYIKEFDLSVLDSVPPKEELTYIELWGDYEVYLEQRTYELPWLTLEGVLSDGTRLRLKRITRHHYRQRGYYKKGPEPLAERRSTTGEIKGYTDPWDEELEMTFWPPAAVMSGLRPHGGVLPIEHHASAPTAWSKQREETHIRDDHVHTVKLLHLVNEYDRKKFIKKERRDWTQRLVHGMGLTPSLYNTDIKRTGFFAGPIPWLICGVAIALVSALMLLGMIVSTLSGLFNLMGYSGKLSGALPFIAGFGISFLVTGILASLLLRKGWKLRTS